MPDETTTPLPPITPTPKFFEDATTDSHVWSISLRGWITVLLVLTVCGMSMFSRTVQEPLYTLVGMAMGYYFGQKTPNANTNR